MGRINGVRWTTIVLFNQVDNIMVGLLDSRMVAKILVDSLGRVVVIELRRKVVRGNIVMNILGRIRKSISS